MDKEKTLRKLRQELEDIKKKFGVEFAEVVRCKDCIHYEAFRDFRSGGYCYYWDYEDGMAPNSVIADGFCSHGERRNGE